jgi:hypothetical protein
MPRGSAASRITCGTAAADEADPAEIVMAGRPNPNREACSLQSLLNGIREARLEVDEVADGVEAWAVDGIVGAQAFVEEAGNDLDEGAPKPRPAGGADRQGQPVGVGADCRRHHARHPLSGLELADKEVGLAEHAVQ